MPKIEEHSKNIRRLRKSEELLFWIAHQENGNRLFPGNVRQRDIALSVVHVQVCFCLLLYFFLCRPVQGISGQFNKAYFWQPYTPNTNNYIQEHFKNTQR